MNARHVGPLRRGAGPSPAPRRKIPDRGLRYRQPELLELADDPAVTPARVLAREPHDQLAEARVEAWTPRSAARICPPALDHRAVPTDQRLRHDPERRPPSARERSTERGEQRAVTRRIARPPLLTAQHAELMAEDKDLNLLTLA